LNRLSIPASPHSIFVGDGQKALFFAQCRLERGRLLNLTTEHVCSPDENPADARAVAPFVRERTFQSAAKETSRSGPGDVPIGTSWRRNRFARRCSRGAGSRWCAAEKVKTDRSSSPRPLHARRAVRTAFHADVEKPEFGAENRQGI
jgi:hypothetical protein